MTELLLVSLGLIALVEFITMLALLRASAKLDSETARLARYLEELHRYICENESLTRLTRDPKLGGLSTSMIPTEYVTTSIGNEPLWIPPDATKAKSPSSSVGDASKDESPPN